MATYSTRPECDLKVYEMFFFFNAIGRKGCGVDDAWFMLSVGSIHKEQIQEARAKAARAKATQEEADRNAERQDRIDRQNQQNVYHNGNQQTTYKTRPYSSTYTTSSKRYIHHVDDIYTPSYN
jgi:hypothetical protein